MKLPHATAYRQGVPYTTIFRAVPMQSFQKDANAHDRSLFYRRFYVTLALERGRLYQNRLARGFTPHCRGRCQGHLSRQFGQRASLLFPPCPLVFVVTRNRTHRRHTTTTTNNITDPQLRANMMKSGNAALPNSPT